MNPPEYTWETSEIEDDFPCTCALCVRRGDWYLRHFARHFPKKKNVEKSSWISNSSGELIYNSLYSPSNFQEDLLPLRCQRCNRNYCKYKNMKNKTIPDMLSYSFQVNHQYPKMVTVGLVSDWNDLRSLQLQIDELKSKWLKLRKDKLFNHFVPGGVYIYEVTKKVTFNGHWWYGDEYKKVGPTDLFGLVKFHVHVHMVIPLQYFRKDVLKAWSSYSTKFGLGRMNVSSKHRDWDNATTRDNLVRYLSKYTTKADHIGRTNRWGTFIGFRQNASLWQEKRTVQQCLNLLQN